MTSAPAAGSLGPNQINVLCRGTDHAMCQKSWDESNWSRWENLGGKLGSAPACTAVQDQNIILTIAANLEGQVQRKSFNNERQDWVNIDGIIGKN